MFICDHDRIMDLLLLTCIKEKLEGQVISDYECMTIGHEPKVEIMSQLLLATKNDTETLSKEEVAGYMKDWTHRRTLEKKRINRYMIALLWEFDEVGQSLYI
jgi:hypothetical protein